jgi:hypothetical protein
MIDARDRDRLTGPSPSLPTISNPVSANVGSQVHDSGFFELNSLFGDCANPHLNVELTRQVTRRSISLVGVH